MANPPQAGFRDAPQLVQMVLRSAPRAGGGELLQILLDDLRRRRRNTLVVQADQPTENPPLGAPPGRAGMRGIFGVGQTRHQGRLGQGGLEPGQNSGLVVGFWPSPERWATKVQADPARRVIPGTGHQTHGHADVKSVIADAVQKRRGLPGGGGAHGACAPARLSQHLPRIGDGLLESLTAQSHGRARQWAEAAMPSRA